MQKFSFLFGLLVIAMSCKSVSNSANTETEFVIAFGSCNKHDAENIFWDDILAENPDAFIWGGDIVYADTDDPSKIQEFYDLQDAVPAYSELKRKVFIILLQLNIIQYFQFILLIIIITSLLFCQSSLNFFKV